MFKLTGKEIITMLLSKSFLARPRKYQAIAVSFSLFSKNRFVRIVTNLAMVFTDIL